MKIFNCNSYKNATFWYFKIAPGFITKISAHTRHSNERNKREYNKLDAMNLEQSGGRKLIFITGVGAITERDRS